MTYVDGIIAPVPSENKEAYIAHARRAAAIFKKHGALSLTECWGDDVPDGKTNSMKTAVLLKPGETVALSWIMWPSKEARDAGMAKVMEDPDMAKEEMPFDGSRLIYGGFDVALEA
ncbi:MAG: DUF1428 domain-containing protein [Pseudomonadota bacterium]